MKIWLSHTLKFRIAISNEPFKRDLGILRNILGIPKNKMCEIWPGIAKTVQAHNAAYVCLSRCHVERTLWKESQSQFNSKFSTPRRLANVIQKIIFIWFHNVQFCVLDNFLVTAYFVFAANLGFSSNVLSSLRVFLHNFATPCSEIKTYLTLAFKSL